MCGASAAFQESGRQELFSNREEEEEEREKETLTGGGEVKETLVMEREEEENQEQDGKEERETGPSCYPSGVWRGYRPGEQRE